MHVLNYANKAQHTLLLRPDFLLRYFKCSAISKQLNTVHFNFYVHILYIIILNHFQQIKYQMIFK